MQAIKQKEGKIAKIQRFYLFIFNKGVLLYRKFRKVLWIGSTGINILENKYKLYYLGFIFLVMPISFAVFLETDYELQKMMKATEGNIFNFT